MSSTDKFDVIVVGAGPAGITAAYVLAKAGAKDYVKDTRGRKQDLLIMRCNLDALWKELEGYFHETDKRDMH